VTQSGNFWVHPRMGPSVVWTSELGRWAFDLAPPITVILNFNFKAAFQENLAIWFVFCCFTSSLDGYRGHFDVCCLCFWVLIQLSALTPWYYYAVVTRHFDITRSAFVWNHFKHTQPLSSERSPLCVHTLHEKCSLNFYVFNDGSFTAKLSTASKGRMTVNGELGSRRSGLFMALP
jgi:hypothetical protein